ncbi:hypothetical protein AB6D74_22650, partial [Vibrio cyclitrophicus]
DYIGKTLKPWPILVDHYTYYDRIQTLQLINWIKPLPFYQQSKNSSKRQNQKFYTMKKKMNS